MTRSPASLFLRQSAPGFTLIELLVVITILTILISLTIPTLSKTRTEARLVVCMSRQRGIGIGYLGYTLDNKSAVPRPLIGNSYSHVMQDQFTPDWAQPVGLSVLYAKGYLANGRAGSCTDHPWSTPLLAAKLDEVAAYGKFLGQTGAVHSIIFRSPYSASPYYNGYSGNGNVMWNWPNYILRWDSYYVPIASKIEGNLQGGPYYPSGHVTRTSLAAPIALFSCAVDTIYAKPDSTKVHDGVGFVAGFGDGTAFRVKKTTLNAANLPPRWSDMFFSYADTAHPSYLSTSYLDAWY